jgi:DNA-directed RNA polymerase subunit alpha
MTVGNSLRRILLSSLEGYAITTVKFDGIDHEFSTINGVIQDVTEIILILKQIRFKKQIEDIENEKILINITGQDEFKAGDLSMVLNSFEVLNSDHVICQMEKDVKLQMEITINKGRGYVSSEENMPIETEFGVIALDSIITPIKNVKFSVENYRVEQKTDYEKLIFEIQTDGSIHPKDALKEAAKILIYHFMLFSDEKITLDSDEKYANEEFDEEILHMRQLLKTKLVDLDLSVRALNCLKAAEVETLGELVKYNKNDLLKFRNFGKKSLTELDDKLKSMNLTFGMDITKFKLENE